MPGLGADSLQGDVAFARVLKRMGATVEVAPDGLSVTGTGPLHGAEINMRDISDTMPTLAAVAPFADGPVRIVDVANTRVKECDRLDACAENLRRLGIEVATGPDWIEIRPGTSQAGRDRLPRRPPHRDELRRHRPAHRPASPWTTPTA